MAASGDDIAVGSKVAVDDLEGGPAEGPTEPVSRKTSTGSGDILLSQIKVIVKHQSDSEEEGSDEEAEKKPKKKMVKKKKKKGAAKNKEEPASPAEILTKTLAQAMRLINEKKEKERQKQKKEEIRRLALQQKERKEGMSNPRVILHC